jgi:hypothetical protein
MRPARQGAFDAMCGIYAIINALDLVGLKASRSEFHKQVFVRLTQGLTPRQLRSAMDGGLEAKDLIQATRPAFQWIQRERGVHLLATTPFKNAKFADTADFLARARDEMGQPNVALIINFQIARYGHWTVARSVTARRLMVRDSGGTSELQLRQFSISTGSHRLHPADTVMVRQIHQQ